MSISSAQSSIVRTQKEVASLQQKVAEQNKKEADITNKIGKISRDLAGRLSTSSFQSKMRDMESAQRDLSKVQSEKSRLLRDLASKSEALHKHQATLTREQEHEFKRVEELEKRQHRDRVSRERELRKVLAETKAVRQMHVEDSETVQSMPSAEKLYDFFISHAHEDKEEFARPLFIELGNLGCKVWYDEHVLQVGDSLRRSIDQGIARSRFGVVVLSNSFFAKEWPQKELDGLTAIEIGGRKTVLPIWHKVTKDEVARRSPMLADRVALNSSTMTIREIAEALASMLES